MRATTQGQHGRLARHLERYAESAIEAGLIARFVESVGDDGTVTIDGISHANFGSCSYLGLWDHNDLKKAAVSAIEQYGVSFSSSRLYTALPLYRDLEAGLGEICGGTAIAMGSTTLAHLSALPSLVTGGDAIVVDRQAHSSLHLATQVLTARDIDVHPAPHDDVEQLEELVSDLERRHERVWYLADGVYSMFGDVAPTDAIHAMVERHPQLYAYLDDAHGFGWAGRHGRGVVLEHHTLHPRILLAISLSKAFGAGGGAVVTADSGLADKILVGGGPLMFGGPIQVPELAAGVAATQLLMGPEHVELQRRLLAQIEFVIDRAQEHGVKLVSQARTPIWFAHIGPFDAAREIARRVREAGYWINLSGFPVVPFGRAGIRFTTTLAQTEDQIDGMLRTVADATRHVLGSVVEIDLRDIEESA